MGNVCGEGVGGGCRSGIKRYEARKKVNNLNKKVRNSNKRYENRRKGDISSKNICEITKRNIVLYFFLFRETTQRFFTVSQKHRSSAKQ